MWEIQGTPRAEKKVGGGVPRAPEWIGAGRGRRPGTPWAARAPSARCSKRPGDGHHDGHARLTRTSFKDIQILSKLTGARHDVRVIRADARHDVRVKSHWGAESHRGGRFLVIYLYTEAAT